MLDLDLDISVYHKSDFISLLYTLGELFNQY